jgi:hypothetical protein
MRNAVVASIAIACGLGCMPAHAQELQITEPPPAGSAVAAPPRGTSMAAVEASFGAPVERYAPVGQPPITRWVYPSFVVFFEYSHVVHAVTRRAAPAAP